MVDIAAERAWMRRHANQQAVETAEAERQRTLRERADEERTCWYCFHDAHVIQYGSGSWSGYPGDPWVTETLGPPVVFSCRDPLCLCGVPPCPGCQQRERPTPTVDERGRPTHECPFCRLQQYAVAYA